MVETGEFRAGAGTRRRRKREKSQGEKTVENDVTGSFNVTQFWRAPSRRMVNATAAATCAEYRLTGAAVLFVSVRLFRRRVCRPAGIPL